MQFSARPSFNLVASTDSPIAHHAPPSLAVDEAFQRLLMDNVLPLASRRVPDNIDMFLEAEDVQRLFAYYSDALEGIFTFYATSDKRSAAALVASAVKAGHLAAGPYAGAHSLTVSGRSPARATRTVNTMKEAMGYPEFLKFATDFDLSSSVILSTLEIGDIYLSSLRCPEHDSTIRKLTFPEFWEALVRCALVAYSKISDASVLDKIRGLFLYMWRAINRSVPRAFSERRNVSTYAGDLLAGAMLFNKRFTAAWCVRFAVLPSHLLPCMPRILHSAFFVSGVALHSCGTCFFPSPLLLPLCVSLHVTVTAGLLTGIATTFRPMRRR